jgi:hypothetical protein
VPALTTAEAARLMEDNEGGGGALADPLRHKPHLLFTWLNDLVRHPCSLDAGRDVIGPDILCWGDSFFIEAAAENCNRCERTTLEFLTMVGDSTDRPMGRLAYAVRVLGIAFGGL